MPEPFIETEPSDEVVAVVAEPAPPLEEEEALPVAVPVLLGVAAAVSYLLVRAMKLRLAERVKRWASLGHVAVWSIAILVSGALLIRAGASEWLFFLLSLAALLVLLNLGWLRSLLAGVALTLEHHLEVGDTVRLDEMEGDIVHFGLRATRIRAVDGTLHDIPNDQLLTRNVANLSGDGSDSACVITVIVPAHLAPERATRLAWEAAIVTPLASPRHRPEVFLHERRDQDDPLRLEIRGYAFDPNYQANFRSDVLARLMQRFEEGRPSAGPGDSIIESSARPLER